MKKDYEITFILSNEEKLYAQGLEEIKETFSEFQIDEIDFQDLGVKNFYFPIKKNSNGRYVVFYIQSDVAAIDKLSKQLGLKETILRFIILSLEKKDLDFLNKRNSSIRKVKGY